MREALTRHFRVRTRHSGRMDPNLVDPGVDIPDDVHLLTADLQEEWREFLNYGKGPPGARAVNGAIWVVRDERGKPVGGARVFRGPPPTIDVEIAPRYRRRGYATVLYQALDAAGFDTEGASDRAVATGMMTPLGYAFMAGRGRKRVGRERDG